MIEKTKKEKIVKTLKLVGKNTASFLATFIFVNVFIKVFGSANVLVGVAIAVAFQTLPACNLSVKPLRMSVVIAFMFPLMGLGSSLSLINPWLGLAINFAFIFLIMLLCCEPVSYKPYMSFLLTYIFCQTTPVAGQDFTMRMISLAIAGVVIAAAYYRKWHKAEFVHNNILRQIKNSLMNYEFVLRMAVGVSFAMLIAALCHLTKPLWISIVVMSLTQLNMKDTFARIKYRTLATVIGSVVFAILFQFFIPPQYAFLVVLLFGYLATYTTEYKYTQIVNAISAINASLVLMDTSTAIVNRLLCLFGGILIVLTFWVIQKAVKHCKDAVSKDALSLSSSRNAH